MNLHEPWKLRFFTLLIPLYTRITRKVEGSKDRGEILGYLEQNPGAHYKMIKRSLGLGNGQLAYHLEVLEKEKRVKWIIDGNLKRFYLKNQEIPKIRGIYKRIYDIVIKIPELNQKQIAMIIQKTPRTTGKYLDNLVTDGKIGVEKRGNEKIYFIPEDIRISQTRPITRGPIP